MLVELYIYSAYITELNIVTKINTNNSGINALVILVFVHKICYEIMFTSNFFAFCTNMAI